MSLDLWVAGMAAGASYGLVALGIVLVYKGTRVINFAQGEFGTLGLFIAWTAMERWGLPYAVAVAFALACLAALGLVVERVVVRPLLPAPRITMLVATIGLVIVFGAAELLIWGADPLLFPAPVAGRGFAVGSVLLTPTRLITFGITPLIGLALYVFLKRTTFGLGVLAASEQPEGVPLTGLSLGRVLGFTWAVAAVVAGVGGILLAPAIGSFHPLFMTLGLSKALAAALVGGLTSLPGAFVGGLAVGITESLFLGLFPGRASLVEAGVFGLILLVLLVRPQGLFGTAAPPVPTGFGRRVAFGARPAVPARAGLIVLAAAIAVVPFLSDFNAFVFSWMAAFAVAAVGLNLLAGYAGQLSLGHAAFVGLGAAVAAYVGGTHDVAIWGAVPAAAAAGAVAGAVVGLPALRIRGMELAVSTLAFAIAFERVILPEVLAGRAGIGVERSVLGRITGVGEVSLESPRAFAYVAIAGVLVAWWLDRNYARSKPGRSAAALRDDESVAASFGIAVGHYKLLAFVVAGGLAAFGGGLFAYTLQHVSIAGFPFLLSLTFIAAVVVGGLRSRAGAIVGVAAFVALPQVVGGLRVWGQLIAGTLVVVTVLLYPGGLAQQGRELVARAGALVGRFRPARADAADTPEPRAAAASPSVLGVRPWPARADGFRGPLLAVRDLSVRFGGLEVLVNVDLEVRRGEIVGLIGPNGAGKTTVFNCVTGFVRPDSGSILYRGREITSLPPHRRAALGIARTFQLIGLAKTESVLTNMLIAQHLLLDYADLEALTSLPAARRQDRDATRRADALLDELELGHLRDDRVADLPHGRLKLVEIACALASRPDLLLLDEPSSGMSPAESTALGGRLAVLTRRFDVTLFVIEHHVPLVLELCDWVYAIDFGRQLAAGTPAEVSRHAEVVSAYLGEMPEPAKRKARRRARSR